MCLQRRQLHRCPRWPQYSDAALSTCARVRTSIGARAAAPRRQESSSRIMRARTPRLLRSSPLTRLTACVYWCSTSALTSKYCAGQCRALSHGVLKKSGEIGSSRAGGCGGREPRQGQQVGGQSRQHVGPPLPARPHPPVLAAAVAPVSPPTAPPRTWRRRPTAARRGPAPPAQPAPPRYSASAPRNRYGQCPVS
jgi:hypothetical protein